MIVATIEATSKFSVPNVCLDLIRLLRETTAIKISLVRDCALNRGLHDGKSSLNQ